MLFRPYRHVFLLFLFCLAAAIGAPAARAAEFLDEALDVISDGFDILLPGDFDITESELRIGVGSGIGPDYLGADNYEPRVLPLVDLQLGNQIRFIGNELRVNLLTSANLRAGALARYRFGRDEDDSPDLAGLGNVGDSVELGGFFEFRRGHLLARGKLSKDVASGHGGTIISGSLEHGIWESEDGRLAFAGGVGANWTSEDYVQSHFGVTPAQSAASGLPAFDPGSSFRDVMARVIGRYEMAEKWRLVGIVRVGQLLGDVDESPLVQERGASTQFLAGAGILYTF